MLPIEQPRDFENRGIVVVLPQLLVKLRNLFDGAMIREPEMLEQNQRGEQDEHDRFEARSPENIPAGEPGENARAEHRHDHEPHRNAHDVQYREMPQNLVRERNGLVNFGKQHRMWPHGENQKNGERGQPEADLEMAQFFDCVQAEQHRGAAEK